MKRHNNTTVAAKTAPRKKSKMGRPLAEGHAMQLSLMDVQIVSGTVKDAVLETVAKKRVSVKADVALCDVQLVIDNPVLMAAMEDAVAKKNASIAADIVVHNMLIEHIHRLRDLNASVAA